MGGLMLTYLLGDVLRIYSGDFKAGEVGGMQLTQKMWLGIAILMVIPIVMVFLSLVLNYPAAYDKFLIIVGLVQCTDGLVCMEVDLNRKINIALDQGEFGGNT